MAKFRKKPVIIEAVQWNGNNKEEIAEFMGELFPKPIVNEQIEIYIFTLEGTMTANKNDWIIKGVKGEFYPCKPDIFEATYEAAEQT